MSAADQVLKDTTRASHRQRHAAIYRIKRAHLEGRITKDLRDHRRKEASKAETTAQLQHLTSDLGEPEGTSPQHITAVALCLAVIAAVWEPVAMSSRAWLFLAVPVTALTAVAIMALPEFLP